MNQLVIDIETFPAEGYFYGKMYETNIIKVTNPEFLLSVGYKWNDERTKVIGLDNFKGYRGGSRDDKKLVEKVWELFDKADVVIGQNSDNFDIKWMNTRFLLHGLPPPSPYKTLDTLKINRRFFKHLSNKLDYVSKSLTGQGKVEHEGFPLWEGCFKGNKKSWAKLKRYNGVDVDKTYEILKLQKPWLQLKNPVWEGRSCPTCNGVNTSKWGTRPKEGKVYQRIFCKNCGETFLGPQIIQKI